jgi:hypothetical protein
VTSTPRARSLRPLAILALLFVSVATGCGATSSAAPDGDRSLVCRLRLEAHASYAVVAAAYRAGKLGTPARVRAEALAVRAPGVSPTPFLRADGTLVPYDAMTAAQRDTFEVWKDGKRVQRVIGRAETRALVRAQARAEDECPPSS